MQDICKKLFDLAQPFLLVRENQKHTESSYNFALKLLEHVGGRPEIVLPAIILHDVGWSSIPPEKHLLAFGLGQIDEKLRRVHEIEGAKIANKLLEHVILEKDVCLEICRIIESHDSAVKPHSLEEKLVKDADKLFRFSPDGIIIDAQRFEVDPIKHWERLYHYIDQWFFTDYAKDLAALELKKMECMFRTNRKMCCSLDLAFILQRRNP